MNLSPLKLEDVGFLTKFPLSTKIPSNSTWNLSCIYLIINLINDKIYVGQTTKGHLRQGQHRSDLRRNCHENKYLQNAYNKYGELAFEYVIIQTADPETLNHWEHHWIDAFYTLNRAYGYNLDDIDPLTKKENSQ